MRPPRQVPRLPSEPCSSTNTGSHVVVGPVGCTVGDGAGSEVDGDSCGVAVGTPMDDCGAVGRWGVSVGPGVGVQATASATTAPRSESDVWDLSDATVLFMRADWTVSRGVVWLDPMEAARRSVAPEESRGVRPDSQSARRYEPGELRWIVDGAQAAFGDELIDPLAVLVAQQDDDLRPRNIPGPIQLRGECGRLIDVDGDLAGPAAVVGAGTNLAEHRLPGPAAQV